jgi:hypothetical protein
MEGIWAFVIVGGPIILGIALLYGFISYRRRDKRLDPLSERSARTVREDIRKEEADAEGRP